MGLTMIWICSFLTLVGDRQFWKYFPIHSSIQLQAMNGLILSAVMKHSSNLIRLLIIACAMIVNTALSMAIFSLQLNLYFNIAFILVIVALKLYHSWGEKMKNTGSEQGLFSEHLRGPSEEFPISIVKSGSYNASFPIVHTRACRPKKWGTCN